MLTRPRIERLPDGFGTRARARAHLFKTQPPSSRQIPVAHQSLTPPPHLSSSLTPTSPIPPPHSARNILATTGERNSVNGNFR